MRRHHLFSLLLAALVLTAAPPAAVMAEEAQAASRALDLGARRSGDIAVPARFEEVRAWLAHRLGLDGEKLTVDTDLIADFQIDATELYYAVVELCEHYGVAPPDEPPSRIGAIATYLDTAEAVAPPTESGMAATESPDGETRMRGGFEAAAEPSYLQTVFFATNREAAADDYFSGARAKDRQLHYGIAHVNIPRNHKRGQLETPWMQLAALNDPRKHIYIIELRGLDKGDFFSRLAADDPGKDDILVYVHGYNVPFEEAVRRGGQIAFDFGFPGKVVAFSWPSDGELLSYNSDREDAYWSVKYLESFIHDLHEKAAGKRIHIIAHSMGSQVLLQSLRLIAYRSTEPLFENVILAAPDFDAVLFSEQIAAEVRPLAANWVIYTSEKDGALNASATINMVDRLGTPLTVIDGYQIIDATKIEVTPWNVPEFHSYYATKSTVIADMIAVLSGRPPSERALVPHKTAAGTFWSIGD